MNQPFATPSRRKRDLIIGAGPAGLTAAWELIVAGRNPPLIIEADAQVGGLSKTVNYRGNRMDLGGHRFFSKSEWVMNWWLQRLPLAEPQPDTPIAYRNQSRPLPSPLTLAPKEPHATFLVRPRLSRIYFNQRFFDYPLSLTRETLQQLGPSNLLTFGASYARARISPRQPERSLEDFLINRFGERLYQTFFRAYTEKVWGVPCREISAEWGAQRIKGLSVSKALWHALRSRLPSDLPQKETETSLIERFLYPTLGPGQLWEEVADQVQSRQGELRLRHRVTALERRGNRIHAAEIEDLAKGHRQRVAVDQVISSMPLADLAVALSPTLPGDLLQITRTLPYRDFITIGLLVERMSVLPGRHPVNKRGMPPDNWLYIQDPGVRLGRIQIYNNWSPAMVASHPDIWLGLEYFCSREEPLWSSDDKALIRLAIDELVQIGLIDSAAVRDAHLVRVPRAYPAYFGSYAEMDRVRGYFDPIENLYLVGRNGMHRYNNQDHSMLTARAAVEAILAERGDKSALWSVNTESDYHESDSSRQEA